MTAPEPQASGSGAVAPPRGSDRDVSANQGCAGRRDARHHDPLPRRPSPRQRRLPAAGRRGARAHGRERRGQVHPHQGAHRRLLHRLRLDHGGRHRPGLQHHGGRPERGHLNRVPRSEPLPEPLGRRERHAGPRAQEQPRNQLEVGPSGGGTPSREPRSAAGHPVGPVEPLHRGPTARGDQPRHGPRRTSADPRRADLEPRPRRGRPALRSGPRPAGQGCRDSLREPLPRPGL